jgi:hypothetical protein
MMRIFERRRIRALNDFRGRADTRFVPMLKFFSPSLRWWPSYTPFGQLHRRPTARSAFCGFHFRWRGHCEVSLLKSFVSPLHLLRHLFSFPISGGGAGGGGHTSPSEEACVQFRNGAGCMEPSDNRLDHRVGLRCHPCDSSSLDPHIRLAARSGVHADRRSIRASLQVVVLSHLLPCPCDGLGLA